MRYPEREPDEYKLTAYWKRGVPFIQTFREWRGNRAWMLGHILTDDERNAIEYAAETIEYEFPERSPEIDAATVLRGLLER